VFSEITLPYINLASRSTTNSFEGGFPFSRSIIVTHAYVKKHTTFTATATAVKLALARATSFAAAKTIFATIILSSTITTQKIGKYLPFTVTSKTFSATQTLNLKALKKEAGAKHVSVMVRYKEK
jgi:hypothetical protein